jgi:hypothetical protein
MFLQLVIIETGLSSLFVRNKTFAGKWGAGHIFCQNPDAFPVKFFGEMPIAMKEGSTHR